MTTETIDRLFLELAQFTSARTPRVLELERQIFLLEQQLLQWRNYATYCNSCAKSGEHDVHNFGAFVARTDWIGTQGA